MKTGKISTFVVKTFLLPVIVIATAAFTACGPTNADKDFGVHSATDGGSNKHLDTDTARTLEDTAAVNAPTQ